MTGAGNGTGASRAAADINIVIAGVGGQGNVRAAQILGAAAVRAGLNARVSDVYGISQRGGPVVSHVRVGRDVHASIVEDHRADVVAAFEPMEALRAVAKFLRPGGISILNTKPVYPVEVSTGKASYPSVEEIIRLIGSVSGTVIALDAAKVAEEAGIPIAANIVVLGVLAGTGALPFPVGALRESIRENIPRALEQNLRAFEAGLSIGKERCTGR